MDADDILKAKAEKITEWANKEFEQYEHTAEGTKHRIKIPGPKLKLKEELVDLIHGFLIGIFTGFSVGFFILKFLLNI